MDQNTMGKLGDHPDTVRATEIEDQLNKLRRNNDELMKRCHALRERLSSVLRPVGTDQAPPTPRPALVPLAEILREIGDGTRGAIEMLENIHNSVEL